MNLPDILATLVKTQNNFDSAGYANCFSEIAVVFDEGKKHHGKKEVRAWIADANERYQATMHPLGLDENETEMVLKVEVSGNFEGSPIQLNYHLELADELIQSLKITG